MYICGVPFYIVCSHVEELGKPPATQHSLRFCLSIGISSVFQYTYPYPPGTHCLIFVNGVGANEQHKRGFVNFVTNSANTAAVAPLCCTLLKRLDIKRIYYAKVWWGLAVVMASQSAFHSLCSTFAEKRNV